MKRLLSPLRQAIEKYNLIEENDKIGVCLSGGKDSISMLYGLKALQRFYPKKFEIIAIAINPGFENFDLPLISKICEDVDVPLFIGNSNAKEIVFDIRKEKNPCSLCANLRRGLINSIAKENGCNKIALGHNMDDVLETFLMNLFYNGNMSTITPKAYMDRSEITLIRPLILCFEKDTKGFIKRNNLSVMDKVCPMDGFSKREELKQFIFEKGKEIPTFKSNLIGAIKRNVSGWEEAQ